MMDRFPFSRFVEVIEPFFDKVVIVETEGCSITGILQDYSSNRASFNGNMLLVRNQRNRDHLILVRKWTAIKLLEPRQ